MSSYFITENMLYDLAIGKLKVALVKRKQLAIQVGKCNSMFFGEFTYPDTDWENLSVDWNEDIFPDVFDGTNLLQLARTPTNIEGNVLDIVALSKSNLQKVRLSDDSFCDHYSENNKIVSKKFKVFRNFPLQYNPNHRLAILFQ